MTPAIENLYMRAGVDLMHRFFSSIDSIELGYLYAIIDDGALLPPLEDDFFDHCLSAVSKS